MISSMMFGCDDDDEDEGDDGMTSLRIPLTTLSLSRNNQTKTRSNTPR